MKKYFPLFFTAIAPSGPGSGDNGRYTYFTDTAQSDGQYQLATFVNDRT